MKHLLVKSIARIRSKLKFLIYDFIFACDNGFPIAEKNNPWWPEKESFGPKDLFVLKSKHAAIYHCGGHNRSIIITFFPAGNIGFVHSKGPCVEGGWVHTRAFFLKGKYIPRLFKYGVTKKISCYARDLEVPYKLWYFKEYYNER